MKEWHGFGSINICNQHNTHNMKKNIAYIDRVYFSAEKKTIFGDMYYTFCESEDTRVPIEDMEDLQYNLSVFIDSDEAEEDGEVGNGIDTDFHIYELHTATLECEDEDTMMGTLDNDKVIEVYICGEESVIPEDVMDIIRGRYEGAEVIFRDADDL